MIAIRQLIAATLVLSAALLATPSTAQLPKSRIPTTAGLAALGFKDIALRHENRERRFLVLEPLNATHWLNGTAARSSATAAA